MVDEGSKGQLSDIIEKLIIRQGLLFLIYEGQYQLYKRGHVAEDIWKGKADMMCGLLKNPAVSEWWSLRMAPLSEDFVQYIESLPTSNEWNYQPVSGVS